MSRRCAAKKRVVMPDAIYKSVLVSSLINKVMVDGRKSVAQKIVYKALDKLKNKLSTEVLEIVQKMMENIMPSIEVKARRVGGATYQVPVEVRSVRKQALGIRWLIDFSRKRSEKTMEEKLYLEMLDAYGNSGATVKKKETVHKMAEANKAFAHYRW